MNTPGVVGIQLTKVSENSIFSQIGIKTGDIISDINGTGIGSTRDLIGALRTAATGKMSIIRIERANQNGEMDPIYVELN